MSNLLSEIFDVVRKQEQPSKSDCQKFIATTWEHPQFWEAAQHIGRHLPERDRFNFYLDIFERTKMTLPVFQTPDILDIQKKAWAAAIATIDSLPPEEGLMLALNSYRNARIMGTIDDLADKAFDFLNKLPLKKLSQTALACIDKATYVQHAYRLCVAVLNNLDGLPINKRSAAVLHVFNQSHDADMKEIFFDHALRNMRFLPPAGSEEILRKIVHETTKPEIRGRAQKRIDTLAEMAKDRQAQPVSENMDLPEFVTAMAKLKAEESAPLAP